MVVRDACMVTTHRIIYEGPSSFAVPTAAKLADTEGVELTSSQTPRRPQPGSDEVLLAVTVQGSKDAIVAAVARIREDLPPSATITIDDTFP
jgi:hypothetical protein